MMTMMMMMMMMMTTTTMMMVILFVAAVIMLITQNPIRPFEKSVISSDIMTCGRVHLFVQSLTHDDYVAHNLFGQRR